jgi:nucleoside-diphosphate-sugar epimerase
MTNENNVLLGYTGLVGSYILRYVKIDNMYNSKNINEVRDMDIDNLYIACIPAVKWYANKYPERDLEIINDIQDIIKTIKVKNRVILISTIDVYGQTNSGMDEETLQIQNNHPYGKHRYMFEEFIKMQFNNYYIIRLPALFGTGLKKNIIYDLLNNNNVNQISKNTYFQWYNLEWLVNDIEICIKNNIRVCNLFTRPINTNDILALFPEYNYDNNPVSTSLIYP